MEKAVITIQPGVVSPTIPLETIPPKPEYTWMPRPPVDCLQGLEYLGPVDTVKIHYKINPIEIADDFKLFTTRYILENAKGEQMYYGHEKRTCCEEFSCSPKINKIHIFDCFKREALTISWPSGTRCGGCFGCCPSSEPRCTVSTQFGDLGTVKQTSACCQFNFDVIDDSGNTVFQIDGPSACHLLKCGKREFKIRQGTTVIGKVAMTKIGNPITCHKPFAVTFPKEMNVKHKGLLLGAAFLISYLQFQDGTTGLE
uniref:Phospholipid scramblase n=1 Tax=Caenorhabditis tropicalis TaxID=1561998 RepID=A0A1I7UVB7_9PELO